MSISDWRRENVNSLVRSIYSAVKAINPNVVFGISPGGFMDALKADDKYYVDLIGVGGESTSNNPSAYEGYYWNCMNKNTAIRRLDFYNIILE